MNDGTPLPNSLTGNVRERVIRMDDALFYLVGGVLAYLADREQLEQTGTFTVDDAREALSQMVDDFYNRKADRVPIGAVQFWMMSTPPDGWLIMNGDALLEVDYPELFAVIGYSFGGGSGTFFLPNLEDLSPMGAGGFVGLMDTTGNTNRQIAKVNLPAYALTVTDPGHIHAVTDPGHTHPPAAGTTVFAGRNAGGSTDWVRATAGATFRQDNNTGSNTTGVTVSSHTTGVTVASGGSDVPIDIVHPVVGMHYIVHAKEV